LKRFSARKDDSRDEDIGIGGDPDHRL
jgi:hypothetical protein